MQEPVDVSSLMELRKLQPPGAPDAVARIIAHFLVETAQRLIVLRQAVEANDGLALERTAHALKGIAGTVGANEMLDLATRVEQIGRERRTQDAAGLVGDLESAFHRARPIFQKLECVDSI